MTKKVCACGFFEPLPKTYREKKEVTKASKKQMA
jgi:hypothetical protein